MRNIKIKVLNPDAIKEARSMMICAARLTQRGEKISDMKDFMRLYSDLYTDKTIETLCDLPHPTIQKFALINIVVVGASRRFLAQITRHQNEVKFMSASLQYSDYSGQADFVVPYELIGNNLAEAEYISACQDSMRAYELLAASVGNDAAGYAAPQGLRNVLIMSATPYQWKHMISQRICRRNTTETRYVMTRIWEALYELDPIMFSAKQCGPFCLRDGACKEGKMCCGDVMTCATPDNLIATDFPKLWRGDNNED